MKKYLLLLCITFQTNVSAQVHSFGVSAESCRDAGTSLKASSSLFQNIAFPSYKKGSLKV